MKTKDIIREEVYTLANSLVEKFSKLDKENCGIEFWENVENYYGEDEDKEVFQWFIVSGWLYEKLKEVGAVVVEYAGCYFWGRCEYGQSTEYDSDIKQVEELTENE